MAPPAMATPTRSTKSTRAACANTLSATAGNHDHDYMAQKRAALKALLDLLNTEPADNVTPIHARTAA